MNGEAEPGYGRGKGGGVGKGRASEGTVGGCPSALSPEGEILWALISVR